MTNTTGHTYSSKAQIVFCQRLGDSWRYLAMCLEIPDSDCDSFAKGDEGRDIFNWLQQRNRLHELPLALEFIERPDLALILRSPAVLVESEGKSSMTMQGLLLGFGGAGAHILTHLKELAVFKHGQVPDNMRFLLFDTIADWEPGRTIAIAGGRLQEKIAESRLKDESRAASLDPLTES